MVADVGDVSFDEEIVILLRNWLTRAAKNARSGRGTEHINVRNYLLII